MTTKFRIERDSMGELKVPADALYAAQTQRAVENFPISGTRMPREFIRALGLIKSACAQANADLGYLGKAQAKAIRQAAEQVAAGAFDDQFPIDVYQTGSGTSSNMNANEVIATLVAREQATAPKTGGDKDGKGAGASKASSKSAAKKASTATDAKDSAPSKDAVNANDHVNMGQSSNDVIPTAIQVSANLGVHERLLPALRHLEATLRKRARELSKVVKTGRTHLMDAMPVTFGQELGGWAAQVASGIARIEDASKRLRKLPQGGTAVGTGINADPRFGKLVAAELTKQTSVKFEAAADLFEGISSQDAAVELSGQLNTLACSLMKIANDLRWMNSGPLAGIGEIELPALQPGSSIMPGKVNPVIPEATAMVCAQVIGNHVAITVGGQSGNFQLNVMLPMIAHNLLSSIGLLANVTVQLADKAIAGFTVRTDHIAEALNRNPILVTALNPVIGYAKGAATAKQAYKEGRPILDVAKETTGLSEKELKKLLDPAVLAKGGIHGAPGGGGG